jgi:hypothetical protein
MISLRDKMTGKKILEVNGFSSGISGTWTRAYEEGKRLAKENEVWVFSSNLENGKPSAKSYEEKDSLKIRRFPVKKQVGFAVFFDFKKELYELEPDIVIAHGYRKPYLNTIVKYCKKKKKKCFLVTHAPFVDKKLRSWKLNAIIKVYDIFYGKKILRSFNKIFAINN